MPDEDPVPALVSRAAAGDESAWGEIVDRYAPLLWSICRQYRLSRPDTDDVAQGVWLRLLEHLPRLHTPAALPGWLATTTRRECLHAQRRAHGQQAHERPLMVEAVPDNRADEPGEGLLRAERRAALRAAFEQLSERCRELLGMLMQDPPPPYTRISADLGMPIGSIGPNRARCLDALRRTPALTALMAADRESEEGVPHGQPVDR